ncbi:arabinogalactan endo-beta-1,4-galactanase [Sphingomonas sp. R1]|uniref:glycoside hydrolase family 53 protein n=1 Tax=Sphingomonas sp. R1 TaxID=399176 RepID=UPI002224CFD7|nr:arabinogalactan endo-1,4-beta-galactosidase [Sphingomonas sp. R1]UYY78489.1 arabinogalactan endo-1,4-beta-galactosidase [Sphingomonas sp. R1]
MRRGPWLHRRTLFGGAALALAALPPLAGGVARAQQAAAPAFAYGADISSVTEQEAAGLAFRNSRNKPTDLYDLVQAKGINAVRLRVWVNPEKPWSDRRDVIIKAKRARDHGMRIMIDFHYSDNWADPGKQFKPAAWNTLDVAGLTQAVADHTRGTLAALKANGIDVTWVQVGNEITNGLLWPDGKTDRFDTIARFTNAGYEAVKAVYPKAQVILHIDNGWDTAKALWWFDAFTKNQGKLDAIGLSYYPEFTPSKKWREESPKVSATMAALVARFAKPVLMVEVGYRFDEPREARAMLRDIIARNQALGSMGGGVFYWEPGTIPSWSGYRLGATDTRDQLTTAMDAFRH